MRRVGQWERACSGSIVNKIWINEICKQLFSVFHLTVFPTFSGIVFVFPKHFLAFWLMALPLLWPDAAHKALFVMENNVQIQSQIHDR